MEEPHILHVNHLAQVSLEVSLNVRLEPVGRHEGFVVQRWVEALVEDRVGTRPSATGRLQVRVSNMQVHHDVDDLNGLERLAVLQILPSDDKICDMPYLPRHIEANLLEASRHFSAIAVMGPRQVGKSTLLAQLFGQTHRVLSFDDLALRAAAQRDPGLFLGSFPGPLILDEIQYVPALLSAVKQRIDGGCPPGEILITGSQQYTLIRNLQETLAGRVLLFELGPMTVLEQQGLGSQTTWLETWVRTKNLPEAQERSPSPVSALDMLFRGGLPGVLTKPPAFYSPFWASYVDTFLTRDLPGWYDYSPGTNFHQFLGLLAALSGQEVVASQLGRDIGVSPATAQRWIGWLKACFLWAETPPWNTNLIKRLSHHAKGFFFDTGVLGHLLRIPDTQALMTSPQLGALWETSVVNQLRTMLKASLVPADLWHVKISSGWEVDLLIETSQAVFALEVKWNSNVDPRKLTGLNRLEQVFKEKPLFRAVIVPQGPILALGRDFYQIPMV